MKKTILEVNGLKVNFKTYAGKVQAVRNVTFDVKKGKHLRLLVNQDQVKV